MSEAATAAVAASPSSSSSPAVQPSRVHIPEIASSLLALFILRTVVSLGLIGAGIACLYFGGSMLNASLGGGQAQTLLFEAGNVKVTAGGFGAVVMAASLVPFLFAYLSRPTINLIPISGSSDPSVLIGETETSLIGRLKKTFRRRAIRSNSSLDRGGIDASNGRELASNIVNLFGPDKLQPNN